MKQLLKKAADLNISSIPFSQPARKLLLKRAMEDEELLKLIHRFDPNFLTHQNRPVSPYSLALLHKHVIFAEVIRKQMEEKHIPLSDMDQWMQKACYNDLSFTDAEFLALERKNQSLLYRAANFHGNDSFVARLNQLGMRPEVLEIDSFFPAGPNTDFVSLKERTWTHLTELRKAGRLLTEREYLEKYPRSKPPAPLNSQITDDGNGFVEQMPVFSRLLGRDYIQRCIDERGSQYPKTPYTLAVIPDHLDKLSFRIHSSKGVHPDTNDLKIKAELIRNTVYRPSAAESMELIRAVEDAQYTDLHELNIFFTPRGAYFVDTEMRNFSSLSKMEYRKLSAFPLSSEAREYSFCKMLEKTETAEVDLAERLEKSRERRAKLRQFGYAQFDQRTIEIPVAELLAINFLK